MKRQTGQHTVIFRQYKDNNSTLRLSLRATAITGGLLLSLGLDVIITITTY